MIYNIKNQIAEFIEWKLSIDKGNEDELAVIISEANSKGLIKLLSLVSQDPNMYTYNFTYASIRVLHKHLEKEGWYKTMAEDKEEESDLKLGALEAHREFMET